MNAFPPPRVVTSGVYALLSPADLLSDSSCVARARPSCPTAPAGFGSSRRRLPWAAFRSCLATKAPIFAAASAPNCPRRGLGCRPGRAFCPFRAARERRWRYLLPFAVSYLTVKAMGIPADAFETRRGWEWAMPVLPATMPVYASIYLGVPLTFFLCADRAEMRRLAAGGWMATGLNTLLYATVPATAAFRPVAGNDWMSQWLAWEQRMALARGGVFAVFPCNLGRDLRGLSRARTAPALGGVLLALVRGPLRFVPDHGDAQPGRCAGRRADRRGLRSPGKAVEVDARWH